MNLDNKIFKILIVDDEPEYREVLQMILDDQGYTTDTAPNGEEALEKLKKNEYNLVLTDLIMGEIDGIELLRRIKSDYEHVQVILITGYGTIQNAVEAMKKGAFTYFIKSHEPEELLKEIKSVQKIIFSDKKVDNRISNKETTEFLLTTKNPNFQKVLDIAEKAAKSSANILILGESGVGKEVFARYIHDCSYRSNNTFIPVNCSTFSDNLLESELFGHKKGSFTGAVDSRKGRFECAEDGTLFLDEIGDISLNTQIKLLRIIETKSIQRIGSNNSIKIDFRLITATNKDLEKEILAGTYREDFFYRISTIVIEIPSLRERKEDLPALIDFFMEKSKVEMNKNILSIDKGVMEFLLSYDYPGNIRELKNIIDRLVILSEGSTIREKDLPKCREYHMNKVKHKVLKPNNTSNLNIDVAEDVKPLKDVRKEVEAEYIEKVLLICNNNITEAAKKLSISRRQLFNKICEYNLKNQ